ncbi:MAG: zinc ribbon domain-containing protein [Acidimicrobiales bacterium]
MATTLEWLLELQEGDLDIDQHLHRRTTLPERAELKANREGAQRQLADAAQVRTRLDEVVQRQQRLESDLEASEARIREVERRLYSGEVSASRELQAMAAEAAALRARSSELEDRVLAVLEEREPLDATLAAAETEQRVNATERQAIEERLAAGEAVIDRELAALNEARGSLALHLPPELLATYERLRSRLGGIGAARLVGDRCGGCHLNLPATELDKLRHTAKEVVSYCDQCGRILVRA